MSDSGPQVESPAPPPPPPGVAGAAPPHAAAVPDASAGRPSAAVVLAVSLVPAAFALFLLVVAPRFYEPLLDDRAGLLGLPPAAWFLVALVAIPVLNLLVLRVSGNAVVVGVSLAITVTIGLFVVILAPAIVLLMVNLGPQPV